MTTIFCHHDADGITSAYFTSFGVKNADIKIADKFGDTTGWKDGDYMVDMRPDNPNIKGTVIDHHLPHSKDRKYKLITHLEDLGYNAPASFIAWLEYKDKIPKKEWWKLAIGLAGDGQIEKLPAEVIYSCPSLLSKIDTSSYLRYGKWTVNAYPIYNLLSSCINAFLRIGGEDNYDEALNQLMMAPNPISLIKNNTVIRAKKMVADEIDRIMKDNKVTLTFGNLILVYFDSPLRMTGYVGMKVGESFYNSTVLAIDTRTGSCSLRGKLANYYKDRFKNLDYLDIDGHPGFMGGTLHGDISKLIDDLMVL